MSFPPRTPSERKFLRYVVLWIYKTNASYNILGLNSFYSINVGYPEIPTTKLLYTVGAKYYSGASLIQTSNTWLLGLSSLNLCAFCLMLRCAGAKPTLDHLKGGVTTLKRPKCDNYLNLTMKKNGSAIIICWHWMIYIPWIPGHGLVPL